MLPVVLAALLLASELDATQTGIKTHPIGILKLDDWSRFAFGAFGWSESDMDACDARNLDFAECATRGTDGGPGIGAGNGNGGGKNKP